MRSSLKLINLIYIPLGVVAHKLIEIYFVKAFSLPYFTVFLVDFLMLAAFLLRLLKRQIPRYPVLKNLIKISLIIFGFFSFYFPFLVILFLVDFLVAIDRYGCSVALGGSFILTIYQCYKVHGVQIRHISIPLPAEKKHLTGLTVFHLSDLHLGPYLDAGFSAKVVKKVQEFSPNFVCITGDLVDGPYLAYSECIEPFQKLAEKIPTFFVTGNHEFYYDSREWLNKLKNYGIHVLRNECSHVTYNSAIIQILGCDDPLFFETSGAGKFETVLHGIDESYYSILLSHRPDSWILHRNFPIHLQLSGHGHGGQAFPWAFIIRRALKFPRGLFSHTGKFLFVHSGTGFWGPPNRWLVPAEICLIEFK